MLQEVYLTGVSEVFSVEKAGILSNPGSSALPGTNATTTSARKAAQWEIPMEEPTAKEELDSRHGVSEGYTVRETLELLGDKDKQILYLYFWREMPQADIAKRLNIPVGTVKSRLYTAKQNFKNQYSYRTGLEKESAA